MNCQKNEGEGDISTDHLWNFDQIFMERISLVGILEELKSQSYEKFKKLSSLCQTILNVDGHERNPSEEIRLKC